MLEALIPFVDYPMKLPLALLVKYFEVRMIMNAFQSTERLSQYGLNSASRDPMDMMGSILGVSPEMLKTLMSLMESQSENAFGGSDNNHYNTNAGHSSFNGSNYSYNNSGSSNNDNHSDDSNSGINNYADNLYNSNNSSDNYSSLFAGLNSLNNPSNNYDMPNYDNNDSFDDNIKQIFAEYDLLQAAEYSSEPVNIGEQQDDQTHVEQMSEPEYYI